MKRRDFVKAVFSVPIAVGLFGADLSKLTRRSRRRWSESLLVSSGSKRSGWINLAEIDEDILGSWWAELNDFDLPKVFGEVPRDVNRQDYLRGAFRILNAFTPEEAANRAWLTKMAPYLEEWEHEKSRLDIR
jgi:hypothetical protein